MEANSGGGGGAEGGRAVTGGGGGGGGSDVELVSKTLQVEHKLFYFDLKENPRGRYLKISEKTSATRSTIIVPSSGISWFLDLFNYYVNSEEHELFSKELQLDSKVFYFDIGENRRGRFLKVSEASVSRNRSTIIVPAGSSPDEGWAAFRNILAEIHEASGLFVMPNQVKPSDGQEHLVDDVGAGFIPGHGSQQPSSSEHNVDRTIDSPGQEETGMTGVSKVIRADQKRFFFDLGNNNRGHFLRISEVAGSDRSSIILPLSGLKQFHEVIGHFVEITKDKIEGMTGANVRTVDPPQR
ncbi:Purine-rich element binding protein family [Arabidopsis thaliana x Arabidopsis arenosa]|uniref:Transcription factor Pur-alpha 1 n=4 Tax=Arabidopsis TaxID=3701 RepID=PUR_ARATH|nr:purin-rich alpha 1 [Arabidopsis thaliana]Q9SKZ1.2 RecName: Full=Transcription factor Pur-alpha 1; AltName: Full=Purine-rich single-stranded DNA-binding protein alpha 1 [Arabidopsis thaliana]KAG7638180.1 Purine-rich element binding protein family [Arabidopsis thaliana x Arabidopsis arenosa]KAG7642795.1 Purine-rich element binding protein family [Arabidopsis suecica]AAD15396.2 putative purine-rich single-stranded DNA-binding protein [Arabidopsis thaliana]AAD39465.1 PUR alpha-1 [Arabidopsis th|eukprot:NP_565736.1 purin-rich alpha 1 [Arabidopsis thaliana]